jgi:hypothetical protein
MRFDRYFLLSNATIMVYCVQFLIMSAKSTFNLIYAEKTGNCVLRLYIDLHSVGLNLVRLGRKWSPLCFSFHK